MINEAPSALTPKIVLIYDSKAPSERIFTPAVLDCVLIWDACQIRYPDQVVPSESRSDGDCGFECLLREPGRSIPGLYCEPAEVESCQHSTFGSRYFGRWDASAAIILQDNGALHQKTHMSENVEKVATNRL